MSLFDHAGQRFVSRNWLQALGLCGLLLGPLSFGQMVLAESQDRRLDEIDRNDEILCNLESKNAPAKMAEPFEITIASYNVQARPFLDNPKEKLPQISPLLNAYDVVLIQECFTRHDLLWSEADFPNKVYFGRLAAPSKVTNSGLSILTRLPMDEAIMEHFRDVGELQNRLASKGILLVRMKGAGVTLDVYNTHMEAGATNAAHKARRGQARQVIEFVYRNSPADHAVLLMGDFNMGPLRPERPWRVDAPNHYSSAEDWKARTEAFETMRTGLGLKDAADEVHGKVDDGIERLLYREGTRCQVKPLSCGFETQRFRRPDGSSLSDGAPLIVRLRITPQRSNEPRSSP